MKSIIKEDLGSTTAHSFIFFIFSTSIIRRVYMPNFQFKALMSAGILTEIVKQAEAYQWQEAGTSPASLISTLGNPWINDWPNSWKSQYFIGALLSTLENLRAHYLFLEPHSPLREILEPVIYTWSPNLHSEKSMSTLLYTCALLSADYNWHPTPTPETFVQNKISFTHNFF